MKDRKFMAALAAGVLSGLLAFGWMASKINNYKKRSTPTTVWVTTVFVPAHSALQSNQVVKKEIPAEFVSPSAIQDIRDVEGLVTLAPLSAGEQVQANEFGYPNNNLVLTLPKGARAFTLAVNDVTGLGGLLEPGDHVDILARLETSQKQLTATALQNILVLATGNQTSRSSANTSPD
ncbi:MAG: Flp pilus assembly protein CpaB, partial [bacterium]